MGRGTKTFTPEAVYLTADGGEFLIRKQAGGFHVVGPWTADPLGCWPTLAAARCALVVVAGDGEWVLATEHSAGEIR